MPFGEPDKSSGSPPEHHPEHPKIPSAALEPLDARSFAHVHRNRPPRHSRIVSAPEPPVTLLQLCKDTVPNTVLPCLPPRRTTRVGGFNWAAPTAADPKRESSGQ